MKLNSRVAAVCSAFFALAVVVCSSAKAHADLLVEPFGGYEFGKFKQSGTSDDISGVNYGARLGYESLGFMIGGEYALGSLKYTPSGGSNTDLSTTDAGIFVGYNFPILFRVYGTYYLLSDASSSSYSSDLKGTGYRVGIGFTGLPFITLALEEVSRTYTKQGSSSLSSNVTINDTLLSVTLPLTF